MRFRENLNFVALISAVLQCASLAAQPRKALVTSEMIFDRGPFAECHASTIAQTRAGELAAAWFGGRREGDPTVGIWLSRQVDGKWSTPAEVATGIRSDDSKGKATRYPCWNPVLFQPVKGPLLLFYKVGPSPSTWWGMRRTSADGGRSWSGPERLPAGILGPIKNKPVELLHGRLLCPSSSEDHGWRVHLELTGDPGKTWTTIGPLEDPKHLGAIQPTILTYSNGKLQVLCRTQAGVIATSRSVDGGLTWSPLVPTDLPNPNSGIDALTLADDRHLLVYNPTKHGRTPLAVAVSRDGLRWGIVATLEDQPGEYSYPAVIQTRDGLVHITYTYQRRRIKHVVVDPSAI